MRCWWDVCRDGREWNKVDAIADMFFMCAVGGRPVGDVATKRLL
jgi:hypothetical protein